MKKLRALITGGCGFVGRHFAKKLLKNGYDITIVDDLSTGLSLENWPPHLRISSEEEKSVHFYNADFRNFCKESTPSKYDLIAHLAAVVGGRMTIEGDPLKVATDLAIDATFFNWIVAQKPLPRKVLYFSSSAVYPINVQSPSNNFPLSEKLVDFRKTDFGMPDMTYGWSKLSGEFLAQFASKNYGLNVVIYRPFSGYGEDQDFTYPFPSVIRRVARKESPIIVWGSGHQLRDFIYIEDALDTVLSSMNHLRPGEPLNIGTGVGTSFRELAKLACDVIGHEAKIVNDSTKPEGVFARVGNCELMLKYYQPKTSLKQGIQIVYDYQVSLGLI